MTSTQQILVAGASQSNVEVVSELLRGQPDMDISVKVLGRNGAADPLHGLSRLPDALVLVISGAWQAELENLRKYGGKPPVIVIGPMKQLEIMRLAMQCGARDFHDVPPNAGEVLDSLRGALNQSPGASARGQIITLMNSKGGSGASFLGCNLAHVLAQRSQRRVALLDMDLQFGSQDLWMDARPRGSILDALNMIDELDSAALDGLMSKHESGVSLLGAYSDPLPLPWQIREADLKRILDVAAGAYDDVVVDLPRQIDPLTTAILENADRVLLVVQQSLIHLRDAQHLLRIMTRDLGVSLADIQVVVNRFQSDQTVSLADIQKGLRVDELLCVPNDTPRAWEAMNQGVPVNSLGRNTAISRAMTELAAAVAGVDTSEGGGRGLRKALSGFLNQARRGDR